MIVHQLLQIIYLRQNVKLFLSRHLIELKNDKPALAVKQIHENNFGGKYRNGTVANIGPQIDFEERNIIDYPVD